ncbi:MAG: hypothetical protein Q7J16_08295 [Candidatus Cloacimonadales bacterium]|nr:hypothetical protein [Candidatus Cloacimonadales bacterium]
MLKRIMLFSFVILVSFSLLYAQDEVTTEPEGGGGGPFSMGGGFGTVTLGGYTYTQIKLKPELAFGKFGIGLDVDLLIDSNGDIRESDWDQFDDYVNKIYYIRYGQRGDAFFGRIGGFPSYTLGHGLVMRDYTNMLRYPDYRQIGVQLGGKLPFMGMTAEVFTSNVVENDILAGRLTIQPLSGSGIPLLQGFTLGGTVAHDANQIKGLVDTDDDNYPDYFDDYPYDDEWHNEVDKNINEYIEYYKEINDPYQMIDTTGFHEWFYVTSPSIEAKRNPSFSDLPEDDITVFALDYTLPIITQKLFTLGHYAEAAKIDGHGMGFIFPGFYSKFLIFDLNLEFRMFEEDFAPSFFDQLYDEQRAIVVIDTTTGLKTAIPKEDILVLRTKSQGWYGSLTSNLFNFLTLTAAYEDMYGEDNDHYRSIWGKAGLNTSAIPKLSKAEIGYYQTGFDKLEEFKTPGAMIDGKLSYALGGSAHLVGVYQERYIDLNGDGKIKGKDETIKTVSMGVEFQF